ncbi:penicillin-binding transpeptidase domain-containing protein [Vibrio breoganii]|uniref:Peptidoglycan D,D-transpeptidase FtsI n=1 Tax=Vibrio breoganii TaxID=553239 RepID=A0AAP8MZ82_9VIBR|nr:penicillin-binding transpeptidase domain-containing protein [Vibrio breoganii]NMO72560.1 peptidoglycan glycosyltransferase FtsI [Vibrio breoganii]NMR69206.1 peptidoglycan glycosyltransferase FtsI [Vibrio breoganii]OCH73054.1 peptidoglycan glycosyltransferase FtsI [Vibrio breoganii]PMF91610.1 peptidoglycan glycosyltransferase FtsI [Vibrio breoganii]PMG03391.1 peptidoglycan glycosyltransferase FtsI [Vibrio breoganii]
MKPTKKKPAKTTNKRTPKKVEPSKVVPADTSIINWRYLTVLGFILLLLCALLARVAYIQVIEPDTLIERGDMRSVRVKAMPSARGIISDRNGEQIAVSVPVEAVYADPRNIFTKGDALTDVARWHALADVLQLDREALIERIEKNKNRRFIYLQRQVSPAMAKYIKELKLKGIGLRDESRRYYPTGEISAHVVGVTGIDSHGLEGVERSYDEYLSGQAGSRKVRKDRDGRVVENISMTESKQGNPLQLTIDQRLQAIAYRAIKQAVADHRATSGSVVLLDVKTGGILAMVNSPSYNPNTRDQLQSFRMRNRAITDSLEPGSSVKPFVVLAALDNGTADLNTVIDTGNGVMRVGGSRVRDTSKVGKADLKTILKKSSNIGVATLALNMPLDSLLGMYQSIGFGSTSGINLVGETTGLFPNRRRWSQFEIATLAFGYGLSVTPLQLAHAYATLGSYGSFKPLHIIKDAKNLDAKQVADPEHAREVLEMLEAVTLKGGTATRAAVPGYRVGAKTGTSRKAKAGGYSDEYVTITAGVAPISNPRVALVVVVNEPQGDDYYGGSVAAPVFSEVLKGALQILNVPPDANKS